MWNINGNDIRMTEGDWGVELPIEISGATFANNDEIVFTLKDAVNGNVVLEKTFSDIAQNTITLEITENETEHLSVGAYVYSLDWMQDGAFLCNIIPASYFKVVEKA